MALSACRFCFGIRKINFGINKFFERRFKIIGKDFTANFQLFILSIIIYFNDTYIKRMRSALKDPGFLPVKIEIRPVKNHLHNEMTIQKLNFKETKVWIILDPGFGMQEFNLYFRLGTEHILTWEALDHILFVSALCLRYLMSDWKKVVVLVTAFTIGHSITLALSALGYVHVPAKWIEFLIPLTILATAINNLTLRKARIEHPSKLPMIYFFALFFGLIHGLAFANTFLSLEGKEGLFLTCLHSIWELKLHNCL